MIHLYRMIVSVLLHEGSYTYNPQGWISQLDQISDGPMYNLSPSTCTFLCNSVFTSSGNFAHIHTMGPTFELAKVVIVKSSPRSSMILNTCFRIVLYRRMMLGCNTGSLTTDCWEKCIKNPYLPATFRASRRIAPGTTPSTVMTLFKLIFLVPKTICSVAVSSNGRSMAMHSAKLPLLLMKSRFCFPFLFTFEQVSEEDFEW